MLKRIISFIVSLLIMTLFLPLRAYAGPKAQTADNIKTSKNSKAYTASASTLTPYTGKNIIFTLRTPKNITKINFLINGKTYKTYTKATSKGNTKIWTLSKKFTTLGTRKVQFKAYARSYLKQTFPSAPLKIKVKHALPETKKPIILDSDRAVLLAKPPLQSGVTQKSHGFYLGTSKNDLSWNISANAIVRGLVNKLVTGLMPETKYYYRAYTITEKGVLKGNVKSFTTPSKREWAAQDIVFPNLADRYKLLFGSEKRFYLRSSPPYGYVGKSEASMHIVKVKIPVWKLINGVKTSGTRNVYVNYKLAKSIKAIFKEIYALDIKFPVAELSSFEYRRIGGAGLPYSTILSHHSFGAAIDINETVNDLYMDKDRRNKNSPYYIPQSVIDIFAKYGWAWGGNFKECIDTMHFQYLGLDLMG